MGPKQVRLVVTKLKEEGLMGPVAAMTKELLFTAMLPKSVTVPMPTSVSVPNSHHC